MTVDTWFNYWINYIVGDLALNTGLNYRERYEHNIQSVIGGMKLTSIKPLHCKMVLNQMNEQCAGLTIRSDCQTSDGRCEVYKAGASSK